MKYIENLTEQEILELTNTDIDKMVRLKAAKKGIKFLTLPKEPAYIKTTSPTTKVYYCNLLGRKLSFTDKHELDDVIDVLNSCKSKCTIDRDYNLPGDNPGYLKKELENANWSSDTPDSIKTEMVYTNKEYNIFSKITRENSKLQSAFKKAMQEYEVFQKELDSIKDEILQYIKPVIDKYALLEECIHVFKKEYLPLAENNEEISIEFLGKAYNLSTEQKDYVLKNYRKE